MSLNALSPSHLVKQLRTDDTDGISWKRGVAAGLVGGGTVAITSGIGTSGYWLWRGGINPLTVTGRTAAIAAVACAELGALSTLRLPSDRYEAAWVGAGVGAASVGLGGTAIVAARYPEMVNNHPRKIAGKGAIGAAIALTAGAALGLSGMRARD